MTVMEKILLVTGASSEVGMQLVREIYKDYSRIYLQYRSMNDELEELIKTLEKEIECMSIQADFADEACIDEMIRTIKETDVLPNQIVHLPSPKAYNKQFHKDRWENFETGWEISVRSAVKIMQAFIPNMSKNRYGRIVFMLTSCTKNYPAKFQSSYVTVKYALLGLMKSLSVEYMDKGITVNGVSPDMMETKFLSEIPEMLVAQNRENSPMGRNILVEEVTPVIAHMLSDRGASMTGQNVGILGGL
jgi:3-oxoacyl-[acyl-carrier protein] reductase